MGASKLKGDRAEAAVMRHALELGYGVAIPFGENAAYDLIVDRRGRLERVQCKYVESDGRTVTVRCRSTNGWSTRKYTASDVDWVATYDSTTMCCYFVPASELGEGRAALVLRLSDTRNGQQRNVRWAKDYLEW